MSKGKYWFWRDTALAPQFLGVDAWASLPAALFVAHMRLWTLELALGAIVTLAVLSKFGYTIPVFFRMLKRKLVGRVVVARPWWYWERFSRK